MGFNCGIVGLPNVGKSTLFNAITSASVDASNYPFCTIDPNIGTVAVPDHRLEVLAGIYRPEKVLPTVIEFVDIAGLVKGASKGEGLGNQFLSHIREVDAIAHVVRCFDDPNVVHVDGSVDPRRDIEVVEAELVLGDLDTVEKKRIDAHRRAKSGEKKIKTESEFYNRVHAHLLTGRLARYLTVTDHDEQQWLRELHLLTVKPMMYVCNVNEQETTSAGTYAGAVREIAAKEGAKAVVVNAAIEAEIAELPLQERSAFLRDLGVEKSGLDKLVHEGYDLLHLITFFTVGSKEVHARTLRRGATAFDAAGAVHSDFQRGFIRAEVMKFEDLAGHGSEAVVKEKGLLHVEGREYHVEDGDIVYIRFNV